MISLDGTTKRITLDTSTTFDFHDVYVAIQDWAATSGNMQYVLPCQGSGKGALGGGLYTDIIYTLLNSWKLKPSGYSTGDQINVVGTLITDDSSVPTVAPTTGGQPVWLFKVATNGIIATGGAGATAADIWDALAADYNTSGTMGEKVNAAGTAGDPWTTDLDTYTTPGTAGKKMKDALTTAKFIALK